ncbi:hypothetical protein L484_010698 [Morus notabilis]|uniref:Uncharacterized protein n=1 Tax=Morus notabilis TaxID=981085 RepID=W9S753_9ROSA|nr:hypothetical protein L484_010698 [Morus notabilis]
MCRLIKYSKEGYARIGVMPRYGDADSIKWFKVETNWTFHIFNCFEDGDDRVWGCRTLESVMRQDLYLDPSTKKNIDTKLGEGLLYDRLYEWRLSMRTGETSTKEFEEVIKVEYHMFEKNTFCNGAAFVPNKGGLQEDDGLDRHVFVIDAK